MASPKELLIDVRTPAEFATGYLSNGSTDALNIEYELIDQLPSIYAALGISVQKSDAITLYCRSGRRSNIALHRLKALGYENVRDIGGFEEARLLLKREDMLRTAKEEKVGDAVGNSNSGEKKEAREKSLGALLSGLRGLE